MTRSVVSSGGGASAATPGNNIFSGTFGSGSLMTFGVNGTFTIPAGVSSIRVRLWGGGGGGPGGLNDAGGGGGGFAIKTLSVTPGTAYAVTIGAGGLRAASGGTSSFGSSVSATGGGGANDQSASSHVGGTGSGGDINTTGGFGCAAHRQGNAGGYSGGGGVGALLGDGNDGVSANQNQMQLTSVRGGGGGGIGRSATPTSTDWGQSYGTFGLKGFTVGGGNTSTSNDASCFTSIESHPVTSIDMIGTGTGGYHGNPGHNGGGGSGPAGQAGGGAGGFPGGGGGACITSSSQMGSGSQGLVIVEY
tara:strand:- start:139 stop:1053 length:915 start_codon:yes stop_codon:yes gene_type:complete